MKRFPVVPCQCRSPGGVQRVSPARLDQLLASRLHLASAFGDVKGLADSVLVPGGACPGPGACTRR
jgi:hypothetical protein